MNKHWYLITFIAVFLANSQLSLAKEETCGKLLSSLFVIEVNKDPSLTNSMVLDEEFCDAGQNEINANYEISFYDALKKKIYSKNIFLNPDIFVEEFDHKKDKFTETQILSGNNSRVLKAPIPKSVMMYDSYRIKSLVNNKETEFKKIILSPK